MSDEERAFWIALTCFRPFGAVRIGMLAKGFETMQAAWEANAAELMRVGIEPNLARRFVIARSEIDPAKEFERVRAAGARAVTRLDEKYPTLLRNIYDPPAVLYVRGELPSSDLPHLAVVGSREPSDYGPSATRMLIGPAAEAGIVIVSGLALGIDACAHETAMDAGGLTIAVLGSGVDDESIAPTTNKPLADRIMAGHGAVISEFPIGTPPLKQHFPFRNRIIAGLCRATLVIEAADKSGSLITAGSALSEGREVWAVPGRIDSARSEVPHRLIRSGATPIMCATDILDQFNLTPPAASVTQLTLVSTYLPINDDERAVIEALGTEPIQIDDLARMSGLSGPVASATISMLEINEAVKHVGGKRYVRI